MKPYYDMLRDILESGEDRGDRTGVGTRSIFGYQARYRNVGEQFPLDTTREINFFAIVHELLWMLRGETNIRSLVKEGVNIWTDWPYKRYCQMRAHNYPDTPTISRAEFNKQISEDPAFAEAWGDCGPVYGKQWRAWDTFSEAGHDGCIDQIANLVEDLKKNPLSRRHIVSAWNVADIPAMIPSGLPPCHVMFQFYCSQLTQEQRLVIQRKNLDMTHAQSIWDTAKENEREIFLDRVKAPKYRLHCQLYQRSLDSVLGAPYNIAAYSLLTMMLAQQCNMVPGDFIHSIGDAHIYNDHREKLEDQLARRPYDAPAVHIRKAKDIFSYTADDFSLGGYEFHPAIRYPIAV